MGLSGPRKRQKISHDPNNTHWSSNTTTFGHKILASQGWTPGQTLGPTNASHAGHFTKASTSHVRVALREDNLGLGAKPGSGQGPGECTGLDSFQDLLGRLNGKTEAVIEKERTGRANVNRMLYAERKYGGWSRFVSAGYLVGGESMQDQLDTSTRVNTHKQSIHQNVTMSTTNIVTQGLGDLKKKKRDKKHKDKELLGSGSPSTVSEVLNEDTIDDEVDDKARRKEARAKRRAEKSQRREDRKRRKQEKAMHQASNKEPISLLSEKSAPSDPIPVTLSSNTNSGASTPALTSGRHAVRQRYIMQKKAAMLDAKALNEILMVKA